MPNGDNLENKPQPQESEIEAVTPPERVPDWAENTEGGLVLKHEVPDETGDSGETFSVTRELSDGTGERDFRSMHEEADE